MSKNIIKTSKTVAELKPIVKNTVDEMMENLIAEYGCLNLDKASIRDCIEKEISKYYKYFLDNRKEIIEQEIERGTARY